MNVRQGIITIVYSICPYFVRSCRLHSKSSTKMSSLRQSTSLPECSGSILKETFRHLMPPAAYYTWQYQPFRAVNRPSPRCSQNHLTATAPSTTSSQWNRLSHGLIFLRTSCLLTLLSGKTATLTIRSIL